MHVDTSIGSQQAAMTDLLDSMRSDKLSPYASIAELCSFGPATGLARASQCLATVATSPSPLRLQNAVADSILNSFGSIRPGTDILFHSMLGN